MEYIKQSMTFEIQEPTVLSLGKFDGLHRGHELLLQYMAKKKQEHKELKAAIFTFRLGSRFKIFLPRCLPPVRKKSLYFGKEALTM